MARSARKLPQEPDEDEDEDMEFEEVAQGSRGQAQPAQLSANADDEGDDDMEEVEFEEAAPQAGPSKITYHDYADDESNQNGDGEAEAEDDEEEEEHDTSAAYAGLHGDVGGSVGGATKKQDAKGKGKAAAEPGKPRIYLDGKGQHAGVSISLLDGATSQEQRKRKAQEEAEREAKRKRREDMITPRDRQNRIAAHKLHLLALLAWCRGRNNLLQDEDLQAWLVDQVPKYLLQRQKQIHPKREPNQRERVRMFEDLMNQLVTWWKGKFKLDPDMVAASAIRQPDSDLINGSFRRPGNRVDGWMYESAAERVEREKKERLRRDRWLKRVQAAKRQKEGQMKAEGTAKAKAKAKATSSAEPNLPPPPKPVPSISLFPPGSASAMKPPAYLRLASPLEKVSTAADLLQAAMAMKGSRETSASLFASLCRALGIPARLVISPQVPPWSVAAAKIATSGGDSVGDAKGTAPEMKKRRGLGSKTGGRKPTDELTSDEGGGSFYGSNTEGEGSRVEHTVTPTRSFFVANSPTSGSASGARESDKEESVSRKAKAASGEIGKAATLRAAKQAATRKGNGVRQASVVTLSDDSSVAEAPRPEPKPAPKRKQKVDSVKGKSSLSRSAEVISDDESSLSDLSDEDSIVEVEQGTRGQKKAETLSKRKTNVDKESGIEVGKQQKPRTQKAKAKDGDYRDDKWKNLKAPLEVKHKVKLRPHGATRRSNSGTGNDLSFHHEGILEPVNLQYPPTVWVEVFSKPFQRWLTVDPVRGFVFATGNRYMEPVASDRQNKLVYVVAFEEDGYARDVTPRYTRTLNSRIAKMRPPYSKTHGDWWESVVRAIARPFKLDRDAMEDAELEDNASREPMPSSVAGFKDHPVYALEKHLKRDEIIFPPTRVGTFQNLPVYLRSNVLSCRSARQWMNEGRSVKPDEQPLKFVKSRAYTIGNKRAEEQAKAEGSELPQEGLYARYQTELYRPPPVEDGKIPTNSFGNIDLYVPTMLPEGAAHIPYNGSAKVAKKLGIPYAEAVIGFEFRKFRGMPKMGGIVVPIEHEQTVTEAFWESEHAAEEREAKKKEQRAMKNWRRLISAVKIAERVRQEYGFGGKGDQKKSAGNRQGQKEVSRLRATEGRTSQDSAGDGGGGFIFDESSGGGGGFVVDEEDQGDGGFLIDADVPPAPAEKPETRKAAQLVNGLGRRTGTLAVSNKSRGQSDEEEEEENEEEELEADSATQTQVRAAPTRNTRGKIVSLALMAAEERLDQSEEDLVPTTSPNGESKRPTRKRARQTTSDEHETAQNNRPVRKAARQRQSAADGVTDSQSPTGRRSNRLASSDATRSRIRATRAAEKELDEIVNGLE